MVRSPDVCRRRMPRAGFDAAVDLHGGDGPPRVALARDLSADGLGLAASAPHPPVGERLRSDFALPGLAVPVSVEAVVAWSEPRAGRLGLRFAALDPPLRELLERWVSRARGDA